MALHDLTLAEQAAAVRNRTVSPLELVDHYLERIDRLDHEYGAFITVTADRARDQARAAQETLARGADQLGPLYGVPTAIKDLNPTKGVRTTFGSAALAEFVPTESDPVVITLEAAGLISLGKTNTPEFGLPCYTEPEVAPPARTPYRPEAMAGGSSGGAAAAVAAGMLPAAQGSDGGGSIRIPAACCGLVGIKPSRGVMPGAGASAFDLLGLGTAGPIARTVADAALLYEAMAGAGTLHTDTADTGGPLRIGRFADGILADVTVSEDMLGAYETATAELRAAGHEVVDIERPMTPKVLGAFMVVWSAMAARAPIPPELESQLMPMTRWMRQIATEYTEEDVDRALTALRTAAERALADTAEFDAILTPALARTALPVGALRDDDDPASDFAEQTKFTPFTAYCNVTGVPAIALPVGFGAQGTPTAIQLIGRPNQDGAVVALAGRLEAALRGGTPFPHPECW